MFIKNTRGTGAESHEARFRANSAAGTPQQVPLSQVLLPPKWRLVERLPAHLRE